MLEILIIVTVFLAVSTLVGAVAMYLRPIEDERLQDRLQLLTGQSQDAGRGKAQSINLLQDSLETTGGTLGRLFSRVARLRLLFEQADTGLTPALFAVLTGGFIVVGLMLGMYFQYSPYLGPAVAATLGALPLLYLVFKRRKRFKMFGAQLPDALELISRALRAGHSLGSGFNLVRDEMHPPISTEFGRVFDEQNLGMPLEESLANMTERMPNLDLKFFSTAVVLQRQTGGDLAEILDKIGYLVRERFRIFGQVQALTGEGRISGVVLLGLPPCLFLAVYYLNREYVMMLFTDEMGKKMLFGAIILQLIGALVIRKIVNIKV